jgi:polyphosphate kinase
VEVLFPIKDAMLKQRIRGEILEAYLADNVQARILQPDGRYVYANALRLGSGSSRRGVYFNAQEFLITLSEGKVTLDSIPQLPMPRRRTVRRTAKAR